MRKQILSFVVLSVIIMSCASFSGTEGNEMSGTNANNSSPSAVEESGVTNTNAVNPSGIEGYEWKLIEVYIDGNNTRFDRSTLPAEPGNFLTLNFDAQNISGVGVPNRYSAPYTTSGNLIKIMLIRSTMMASFFQPENITEHDFFNYLQNAHEWKLANNNLELLSKTQSGSEVRLVFSL